MNFKWIKTTTLIATLIITSINASAQDLLARQAPIDRKLKAVDSLALQKQLKALQDKGYIVRLGGARGGYWHVALVCTTSKGGQIINGGQNK